MPRFSYKAIDANGAERSGSLEAVDGQQAALALRGQGLFPTQVGADEGSAKSPAIGLRPGRRPRLARRITTREIASFTRQLSILLRAGMPLLRGLEVLARQERNPSLQGVIASLADQIKSGGSLSDAMAHHSRVFDGLYLNMIRAGEAGGVLDVVLDRVARFQEKSLQLRGRIQAAMLYPAIVLAVAVSILAGLLVFVVPRFKQIFADLLKGAPLPPLTQLVLAISETVRSHFLVCAGMILAVAVLIRWWRGTATGERWADSLVIRLPLFGPLLLKAFVARFGRTLGTLLSSGVPILPALLITRGTCGNRRVADVIATVHECVKGGSSVARPLEESGVFPGMVTSMIDVGEHTGQLPAMLAKVADIYEEEVDNAVAGLSSLIEPVLILVLAIVVGTIVIALFLPIVRIVQLLT